MSAIIYFSIFIEESRAGETPLGMKALYEKPTSIIKELPISDALGLAIKKAVAPHVDGEPTIDFTLGPTMKRAVSDHQWILSIADCQITVDSSSADFANETADTITALICDHTFSFNTGRAIAAAVKPYLPEDWPAEDLIGYFDFDMEDYLQRTSYDMDLGRQEAERRAFYSERDILDREAEDYRRRIYGADEE